MEKRYFMKMNTNKQKRARIAIVTPDKIDFNIKPKKQETKKDPTILLLGIYLKNPKTIN